MDGPTNQPTKRRIDLRARDFKKGDEDEYDVQNDDSDYLGLMKKLLSEAADGTKSLYVPACLPANER